MKHSTGMKSVLPLCGVSESGHFEKGPFWLGPIMLGSFCFGHFYWTVKGISVRFNGYEFDFALEFVLCGFSI